MTITPSLRGLMKVRGLNNSEVAARLGINRRTVHRWRSGEHGARRKHFIQLCRLLNVNPTAPLHLEDF
jgi:hypothetical protein